MSMTAKVNPSENIWNVFPFSIHCCSCYPHTHIHTRFSFLCYADDTTNKNGTFFKYIKSIL